VFYVSIGGAWSFVWGLSPRKPPRVDGTESWYRYFHGGHNYCNLLLHCFRAGVKMLVMCCCT